jgi:hypothetical protein
VGLNLTPQKSIVLKPHDKPQIKENRLGKLMPKTENPGGNALRGLRLDLGCNTITAATLAVDITMTASNRYEISTDQTINPLCRNGGRVL